MKRSVPIVATCLLVASLAPRLASADPPPAPVAPPAAPSSAPLRFAAGTALTTVGALMFVVGGVLGVRAIVDKNAIGSHCDRLARCDLAGYSLGSEATDFARVATVMFAVGVVAAGPGIPLLVLGARGSEANKRSPSASLGLADRALMLRVRW